MVPRVSAPPAGLIAPRAETSDPMTLQSALGNPRAQAPLVHWFKESVCVCVHLPSVYSSLGIWQVESSWPTALSTDNPSLDHFSSGSGMEENDENGHV